MTPRPCKGETRPSYDPRYSRAHLLLQGSEQVLSFLCGSPVSLLYTLQRIPDFIQPLAQRPDY